MNNSIRTHICSLLEQTLNNLKQSGALVTAEFPPIILQKAKDEKFGDFATSIAMQLAKSERKAPFQIAEIIAEALTKNCAQESSIEKVEVVKPGFINIFLSFSCVLDLLKSILAAKTDFGKSNLGADKNVNIEFVSANPTGPLTVGHGRAAVIGDVLARVMDFAGYQVTREYFFNDAGNQMRVLADSVYTRYRQLLGEDLKLAEDHYQGEYIVDIAKAVQAEHSDALTADDMEIFKQAAEDAIFAEIKTTLKSLGVVHDVYYNEHSLYTSKKVWDLVDALKAKDLAYDKDDAVWFKASEFGGGDDRVIVKSSGDPTYRLPDIAYHIEKIKRGFEYIIDIFGADHHATVPDVMAGVKAMGYSTENIKVLLHQFVTLTKGGVQVKMSTRKANYVTLDELMDELGADAVRYFYNMRKMNAHLEFDLELAKKHSMDNPVFYVQYAHARIANIFKKYPEKTGNELIDFDSVSDDYPKLLTSPKESALIKSLSLFPRLVTDVAESAETHRINEYLYDVATQLQSYYTDHRVISDDENMTIARLTMVRAVQIVLQNGLYLLGITAPERM